MARMLRMRRRTAAAVVCVVMTGASLVVAQAASASTTIGPGPATNFVEGETCGNVWANQTATPKFIVSAQNFDGSYNVSPRHLPDGKGFIFVRRDGGRFNLAISDFATRQVQVLTQGADDESPSVAPNGKLILYASENGGRGILAAVSSDGRVKQRLTAAASDVREPAWGPLTK